MPRHLITSALPRAGGASGIVGLAGSLLPADAYCRFLRARGEEVLFVAAGGAPPAGERLDRLGVCLDAVASGASPQSEQQTQYFVRRLEQEGFVEMRSIRQPFSSVQGRFLTGRHLIGTCPHCRYDCAHGDQCGGCGRLLEPAELLEPRPAVGGGAIEARPRRHLFLVQTKLAGELRAWWQSCSGWSPLARSVCRRWLEEGIADRGITHEHGSGVPVSRTGFEGVVYCSRFGAPIAYVAATHEWAEASGEPGAWRRWWRAGEDLRQVQFMGWEEVPFHAACFPSALIGSREAWKLADVIKALDRLTYYGEPFPADGGATLLAAAESQLDADCWRYFLLANAPEAGAESFSWEALTATVNADLVDLVGSFAERSIRLARRFGTAPPGGDPGPAERELAARVDVSVAASGERIAALEFRRAVAELRDAWRLGSEYLDRKRPEAAAEPEAARTARVCLNLVALLARLSAPVIPFTAERLLDALAVPSSRRGWPSRFDPGAAGAADPIVLPAPLFERIETSEPGRWRDRFGPSEAIAPATRT